MTPDDIEPSCLRAAAPASAQRIAWAPEFGQRYIITVDTEEEFDWSAPFDRQKRAVTATAAIPAAARRFADLGTPLVYLVDHPIVSDAEAVEALSRVLEDGASAVGAQLHPWVNPPFDEAVTTRNSFAGNLPPALEAAKIAVLTRTIAEAFGTSPIIYRAGRYGLGRETLRTIATHGYRIDSSMRARYDYSAIGGPDYSQIGNAAFAIESGAITELPLTTVYIGALRRVGAPLDRVARRVPYGVGGLARAGLLGRVALSPEGMPLREALEAIRVVVGEGLPLLNFSFHSPSLVPGHTPYVRSDGDLTAFWRWWDAVLGLLDRRSVRAASLAEVAAAM